MKRTPRETWKWFVIGCVLLAAHHCARAEVWVANVTGLCTAYADSAGNTWSVCKEPDDHPCETCPCPPGSGGAGGGGGSGGGSLGGGGGCGGAGGGIPKVFADGDGNVSVGAGCGGGPGGGAGAGGAECCEDEEGGMPHWHVWEPNINVTLRDIPLKYHPSRGSPVKFKLLFKNRLGSYGTLDNSDTGIFSFGTNWFSLS